MKKESKKKQNKKKKIEKGFSNEFKIGLIVLGIVFAIILIFSIVDYLYNQSGKERPVGGSSSDTGSGDTGSNDDLPDKCKNVNCDDGNKCTVDSCSEGVCSNVPGNDGGDCSPPQGGFCKDGSCIKRDCSNVYNPDFIVCPENKGSNDISFSCCAKGEACCQLDKKAAPVCCNTTKFTCASGGGVNYCKEKTCNDTPQTPVECPQGKPTICCPTDKICVMQKFLKPTCMDDKKECDKETEEECVDPMGSGILCCQKNIETCVIGKAGIGACMPIKCSENEHLCQGTGDYAGKASKCCKGGEVCVPHPSGYPRCVNV